jgi:hypothetical protein
MREELDKKLVSTYPNLYKQRHLSMQETAMCWGFSCGDGWYDIIDELSAKIEPLGAVAVQVKEKFGGLRFYIEGIDKSVAEEVYAAIGEAEAKSYKTCEGCGEPGETRGQGWIITMCDKCWDKRQSNLEIKNSDKTVSEILGITTSPDDVDELVENHLKEKE